jgi:hypothetical protein
MNFFSPHSFHIPVMGLGFTIDTPVKVAKYGISSVISIIEDSLIEQMREVICKKEGIAFKSIPAHSHDSRAKRITAYLDLIDDTIKKQMDVLRAQDFDSGYEINHYFEMLPDGSALKERYYSMKLKSGGEKIQLIKILKEGIVQGSVDVNIMTKLDKVNTDKNGDPLPVEYSDALAALRGFANSKLDSSIIFSAGLNPRLYNYCESFKDFYPDENGYIKKKIILKVSDYRSALIQGKFLAKKGLWVSEFRVESGINCGGHAFISSGILMGSILEEFKNKRVELWSEIYEICSHALVQSNRFPLKKEPVLKITAQGGVGTAGEHEFLSGYYNLDSVGWGSPFLLVPEATNVDDDTLKKLVAAKQEDYYLSHASPLGVPFNNFRLSSSEEQRKARIEHSRPGSPCYKKFLISNTEFTETPICTASRLYQKLKIEDLRKNSTDEASLKEAITAVTEKDCLCEGLAVSALLNNEVKAPHKLNAVTICPGPNLAYFSGVFSLKQMVDHIYGRINILNKLDRPNIFVNELQLYADYLKTELEKNLNTLSTRKAAYFQSFRDNLLDGIQYYETLFGKIKELDSSFRMENFQSLRSIRDSLNQLFKSAENPEALSLQPC